MTNRTVSGILGSAALLYAGLTSQHALADAAVAPAAPMKNTSTKGYKADNSAINRRDRPMGEVTADQQPSGTTDTEITRQIRQALVADADLSVDAHNIKIITVGGVVTLKGPVKSTEEKNIAVSFARSANGVSKVKDQLSIQR